MKAQQLPIAEYTYHLPHQRIAAFPLEKRDDSKLLVYKDGVISEDRFYQLSQHLPPGTTLVLNETRVIAARILFQKPTGGTIEVFCLEPYQQSIENALGASGNSTWRCLIGGASKWKPGQILEKTFQVDKDDVILSATYQGRQEDSFIINFTWEPGHHHFGSIIGLAGAMPLPPYIKRAANTADAERYQTVFSRQEGSVAAPTAALHFTHELFEELSKNKVSTEKITLHVGAGTFKPVKSDLIGEHPMHREPFTVNRQTLTNLLNAKTLVAVGTTSLRTLESLHWLGVKLMHGKLGGDWTLEQWEAYELMESLPATTPQQSLEALVNHMENRQMEEIHCSTSLLIAPGYPVQLPHGLITNFHQPQSTLLLLVAAMIGEDWRKVYQHALDNDYRFLSYGDSSLLWKR